MSKTQLSGKRIRNKSLTYEHFVDGMKIPEGNLTLNYATHGHSNKAVIDKIRYTGANENIDLRDLELLLIEVVAARRNGNNLGGTIDSKADRGEIDYVKQEVDYAKGDYQTLADAIRAYGVSVDDKLAAHIGAIGHPDLDAMYADYIASKAGTTSLSSRLDEIAAGTGGPGGGVTVNLLRPWTYKHTTVTEPGEDNPPRVIPIPYDFVPNTNAIQVYEGPLAMLSGISGDFVENDDNSITFNYDLPEGTVITVTGVNAGTLYVWRQVFRTTEGQTLFQTMDAFNAGLDEIIIYENGLLLQKDVDYEELDNQSIQFKYPLPINMDIVICRRR